MKGLNRKGIVESLGVCALTWLLLNFALVLFLIMAKLYFPVEEGLPARPPNVVQTIDFAFQLITFLAAVAAGSVAAREKPALKNALVAGGVSLICVLLFLVSRGFAFSSHLALLFFGFIAGGFLRSRLKANRVLDSSQPPIPFP